MKHEKDTEQEKDKAPAAESAEAKAADQHDQLLRLKADFENTKKRLERDKGEAIKFANELLLVEILPIVDNFDRAMESLAQGHDPEKVKQGLKIAQEELHKILEEHGVEVVKSVGEPFDPNRHEAVAMVDSADAKEGTVMDEIQKGYLLNGRLIRPSKVRIAQQPQD